MESPRANGKHPNDKGDQSSSPLAQHVRDFLAEVSHLNPKGEELLTDALARWLAAHYLMAAKAASKKGGEAGIDLHTLRVLSADVVALRRGDHYAERLVIEREQLALDREQSAEHMEKRFREWARKPENKRQICDSGLSIQERAERLREVFGLSNNKRAISPSTLSEIEAAAKIL